MINLVVNLQNNRTLKTEVESFDAKLLTDNINRAEITLVAIGNLVVNKHHIECVYEEEITTMK